MSLEGQYIEYDGRTCIVVCFDGIDYWLVPEERIEKSNQIFEEDMFIRVNKEDMQDLLEELEL